MAWHPLTQRPKIEPEPKNGLAQDKALQAIIIEALEESGLGLHLWEPRTTSIGLSYSMALAKALRKRLRGRSF